MKNVKWVENLGKQNAPHRFSGYVDLTLAEFEALQLAKLLVACALRISVGSSELIKGLTFADKFDGFKAFPFMPYPGLIASRARMNEGKGSK